MNTIAQLIHDVAMARNEFIALIEHISEQQATLKPLPDENKGTRRTIITGVQRRNKD